LTIWTTLKHFVSRQASTDMSPWGDYWYSPRTPTSASGVAVSPEMAQQITTISACVKLISETAATVPLMIYKEVPAGKERANDIPLSMLLRKRPNRWQTSLAWRAMMTGHAALRGRAYSEMIGRSIDTMELIPRHPDRVRAIEQDDSGFTTVYGVRDIRSGVERPVPARQMFVLDGPWNGRSPVDIHREAIALGIAMQEQAGRFFGNGSRPGGVLKSPEGAKFSKEQREELKRSWEEAHRGPANSNRVAVLEGGLEWQQIGLSADDSQFVQSRLFHVAELCRIWNVPPYKVQEYGRATWSNTEQQAIEFLTTCMLPWFRRWEEAIGWYLIDDSEPLFAEFLLEGLLRGDTATDTRRIRLRRAARRG
jgi:HK97 family phage portal protein